MKNSNGVSRPAKIQKLLIPTPSQILGNYTEFQYPTGEGTDGFQQEPFQDHHSPAYNKENQQEDLNSEATEADPFLYYEESNVQDSTNQCKNSIIGKILSDKPISSQVLYNIVVGIWCNHVGLKINSLKGKLYQIKLNKEED